MGKLVSSRLTNHWGGNFFYLHRHHTVGTHAWSVKFGWTLMFMCWIERDRQDKTHAMFMYIYVCVCMNMKKFEKILREGAAQEVQEKFLVH